MLASVCLLVGLVIGGCGATMLRAWAIRGRPALSARDEESNVFDGTVFPAPHDARWRRVEARDQSGADVFVFGDSDIRLSLQSLRASREISVSGGTRIAVYYSDVQRCYYAFKRTLALQSVEMAVFNAGFGRDEAGTSDGTPEKREVPQLVAVNQASRSVSLLDARDARWARYPGTSPVFRVDDTHVLPHPTVDGWKHGDSDRQPSVFIGGGGHSLTVFKDGDVFLDAGWWFKHKKASELYDLVVAHLPPKVSEADKQRMAAEEMMAKLTKARA